MEAAYLECEGLERWALVEAYTQGVLQVRAPDGTYLVDRWPDKSPARIKEVIRNTVHKRGWLKWGKGERLGSLLLTRKGERVLKGPLPKPTITELEDAIPVVLAVLTRVKNDEKLRGDPRLNGSWVYGHHLRRWCRHLGIGRDATDEAIGAVHTRELALWKTVARPFRDEFHDPAIHNLELYRITSAGESYSIGKRSGPMRDGRDRLVIDVERQLAILDGARFDLPSERVAQFLKVLHEHHDTWVPGKKLRLKLDLEPRVRIDRIKNRETPAEIRKYIESHKRKGYRLRLT